MWKSLPDFNICGVSVAEPEVIYAQLNGCHPHMTAYLKKDIPDWLHYKNNEFIQEILLIADEGWTIVQRGNKPKYCTTLLERLPRQVRTESQPENDHFNLINPCCGSHVSPQWAITATTTT